MDYFVTVQGIINEHPQLSSHVKPNINPVVTAVKCSLIERKEYGDHVNLTLRTSSGIVIHKIIMKTDDIVNPSLLAFTNQEDIIDHFFKWFEKKSS